MTKRCARTSGPRCRHGGQGGGQACTQGGHGWYRVGTVPGGTMLCEGTVPRVGLGAVLYLGRPGSVYPGPDWLSVPWPAWLFLTFLVHRGSSWHCLACLVLSGLLVPVLALSGPVWSCLVPFLACLACLAPVWHDTLNGNII